jgi:hypothetical protein
MIDNQSSMLIIMLMIKYPVDQDNDNNDRNILSAFNFIEIYKINITNTNEQLINYCLIKI